MDNIGPQYNRGTGERGAEDRSQKLLTNTKKVRGLRSFLWIKPNSSSAQTAFLCQVFAMIVLVLFASNLQLPSAMIAFKTEIAPESGQKRPHLTRVPSLTCFELVFLWIFELFGLTKWAKQLKPSEIIPHDGLWCYLASLETFLCVT